MFNILSHEHMGKIIVETVKYTWILSGYYLDIIWILSGVRFLILTGMGVVNDHILKISHD